MIICIEGPSAVGKTSTCKLLEKNNNAFIVKETIFKPLVGYSLKKQALFYLQKEADRWNLAQKKLLTHPIVLLDSDPLKPIWFNWAFGFIDCLSLLELEEYFKKAFVNGDMGYPDGYVILTADERELMKRREGDQIRRRPEFEKLQCINTPRLRYYEFINTLLPGFVEKIEAVNVETNYESIEAMIQKGFPKKEDHDEKYLEATIDWINKNK